MLKAKLVVVGGDAKSNEVNLKLPCVIGRGREATLTLPHPLVSRQHTEIFEKYGKLYVRDLGSLNGTFLNNKRLESEQPLEPNQLLTLGNVTFRAIYEIGDTDNGTASAADTSDSLDADTNGVALPPFDETVSGELDSEKETVYDDTREPAVTDTDTSSLSDLLEAQDKRIEGGVSDQSDLFTGIESGEKQHSAISSLKGLPETPAAVSFRGGIDVGDDALREQVVEAVDVVVTDEFGNDAADDSRINSFIKKLPK